MIRIVAILAGIVLIGLPAWWLKEVTIPLPAYRKGGADFYFFIQTVVAVYGSVLIGIVVHWARAKPRPSPFGVFKAGMLGVLAVCIVFLVGGFVYGFAKYGAFDKAIGGNLWGLLVIFWGILGAFVSAGIALLFYAWHGSVGHPPTSSEGGPGIPSS